MSIRARFVLVLGLAGVLVFGSVGLAAWVLWAIADEPSRAALMAGAEGHLAPTMAALLLAYVALAMVLRSALNAHFQRASEIGEQIRSMNEVNPGLRLDQDVPSEFQAIVQGANALADSREGLRASITSQVNTAKAALKSERDRLAALMSELTQSVVVCNRDGRILLYNARARRQFRALSDAPDVADGHELIGLGRSIYSVLDRSVVQHAREVIERQMRRGSSSAMASFISARGGSLLRVRVSRVSSGKHEGDPGAGGFILLFDDISNDFRRDRRCDELVRSLSDEQRPALRRVEAALDALERNVDSALVADARAGLDELARRIEDASCEFGKTVQGRWLLESMRTEEVLSAAKVRIEQHVGVSVELEPHEGNWLCVDSFSLLHAMVFLAARAVDVSSARKLILSVEHGEKQCCIDMSWDGTAASTETLMGWQIEPIDVGGFDSPLSVRDVMQRHGGEVQVLRDRERQRAALRFVLPQSEGEDAEADARAESRPEYYDFDLFKWSSPSGVLDDVPLSALSYTVFDTETTGLDPTGGDEIIQIGATRIVNGKLRRGESFKQLVDPKRGMSAESIAIHHIQPEDLHGQPTISDVLPAFRAYAADSVLLAHNAAFDMRFLELKEQSTGVVFDLPVLDTLLLSAWLHPNQESHRLEAIAERLGVPVVDRHCALGDAVMTAEVFLRMLPLLSERGIRTLGEARAASQKTYFSRLKY